MVGLGGEHMTNEAKNYGVIVEPASATGTAWRAVNVRHLSGHENNGRHNIFVKVFDSNGNRDRNLALRASWKWEGQRVDEYARPAQLDKRDGEIGHGDIPLEKGQVATVWISGNGMLSDRVSGIHIMHANEDAGNSWGHHSFAIEFQKLEMPTMQPPVDPPTDSTEPPVDADLAAQVARNTADIKRLLAWVDSFEGEL